MRLWIVNCEISISISISIWDDVWLMMCVKYYIYICYAKQLIVRLWMGVWNCEIVRSQSRERYKNWAKIHIIFFEPPNWKQEFGIQFLGSFFILASTILLCLNMHASCTNNFFQRTFQIYIALFFLFYAGSIVHHPPPPNSKGNALKKDVKK